MKFFRKLERKYGRYASKNLPEYMTGCFIFGYLLCIFFPAVYTNLIFDDYLIFVNHEYWRLFTWIFTMPGSIGFFTLIMLFMYYSISKSIVREIGAFMYNIYFFSCIFSIAIGTFIVGSIEYADKAAGLSAYVDRYSEAISELSTEELMYLADGAPSHYILISIFLCFALLYPNSYLLVWFIIPFKVAWMAIIDLILLAYEYSATGNIFTKTIIVCVLINFIIMYIIVKLLYRNGWHVPAGHMKRKRKYKKQVHEAEKVITMPNITRHKCAVCGKSEKDDPEMEFRFCSKCNGNYEYCSEHLYTHEHVK